MAGLTHSNDTTGKDKKRQWLPSLLQRLHVGRSPGTGAGKKPYGKDRKAYHLTADYNWGYTTEEIVRPRPRRWAGKP